MIPKDQLIAVCGEILGAPLYILGQIVGICHGRCAGILNQALYAAVHDLIDLVDAAADDVVAPVAAAACIYKQIDLLSEVCGSHLLEIRRAHSAAGLQIGSAQIYHDRDGVFAAALDLCIFFPRSARNGRIQLCIGSVFAVPSGGKRAVSAIVAVRVIEVAVTRTGGIVLLGIPVVAGGRITAAAAAPSAKKSAEGSAAAQQRDNDQNDQRHSSESALAAA